MTAHNLVFTQPSQRMAVVHTIALPIRTHRQPRPFSQTPTLKPRPSAVLKFTAPKAKGIYPYVCTLPGHGLLMYGAMYVGEAMPSGQGRACAAYGPRQGVATCTPGTSPVGDVPHLCRTLRPPSRWPCRMESPTVGMPALPPTLCVDWRFRRSHARLACQRQRTGQDHWKQFWTAV